MPEPLFDPAYVPADVVSSAGVAEVNAIIERLRAHLIDRLEMQEAGSRFRVSNMIRVYSQSHLRRSLQLIEAAHHLVYSGHGLVAIMMVRGLYETIANYVAIATQLEKLIQANAPLQEIHDFIHARTFATRSERLIEFAGTDDVKSTNILTQIKKMARQHPSAEEEYEYLCEHTHPNAFGAALYFIEDNRDGDICVFADQGHDPKEDLKWVLVGAYILRQFADTLDRLDALLPGLSERGTLEAPQSQPGQ